MLIALTGYAGAGKDTVGEILVDRHGFTRVSFAAALKAMAVKLDPILEIEDDDTEAYHARLSQVCEVYGGLEQAKTLPAVRRFLQHLGTEVVRETFGRDAWVQAAKLPENLAVHGNVVVTDCRFRNEARACEELGGHVVRVVRPGVAAVNGHASEHDLDDWPNVSEIHNAGTIDELAGFVHILVNTLEPDPIGTPGR